MTARQAIEVVLPAEFRALSEAIRQEVLYQVSYRGYLEREKRQIAKLADLEHRRLPMDVDYHAVKGLRRECAQKLAELRPANLGQASRISGVNPADISVLLVLMESRRRAGQRLNLASAAAGGAGERGGGGGVTFVKRAAIALVPAGREA